MWPEGEDVMLMRRGREEAELQGCLSGIKIKVAQMWDEDISSRGGDEEVSERAEGC